MKSMILRVGFLCAGALLAAEETKPVKEVSLPELVQVKLENLDLKFKSDLAAMNLLQARLAEYKKQYEELVAGACREAGFTSPCVVEGKIIKPQPPPAKEDPKKPTAVEKK